MTSDEVLVGSVDHYSWMLSTSVLMILPPNSFQGSDRQQVWRSTFHVETRRRLVRRIPAEGLDPCGYGVGVFLFATRHLIVVCIQTFIFRCCIVFEAAVCRLYEMLYPCICNVVISCWKSGAYDFVICRGGTDMCFVLGFGWKLPVLKQYHILGLTPGALVARPKGWLHRGPAWTPGSNPWTPFGLYLVLTPKTLGEEPFF